MVTINERRRTTKRKKRRKKKIRDHLPKQEAKDHLIQRSDESEQVAAFLVEMFEADSDTAPSSGPLTVEELAALGCTQLEIARVLGCAREHFRPGGSQREAWERGRARGAVRLRRAQEKLAVERLSAPMLIHLGKHRLGQQEASGGNSEGAPSRAPLDLAELATFTKAMLEAGVSLGQGRQQVAQNVTLEADAEALPEPAEERPPEG